MLHPYFEILILLEGGIGDNPEDKQNTPEWGIRSPLKDTTVGIGFLRSFSVV